jgi:hypothetical protein
MTEKHVRNLSVALLLCLALVLAFAQPAYAHIPTPIGPYVAIAAWQNEPPIVGQQNAIAVFILRDGAPVASELIRVSAEVSHDGVRESVFLMVTESSNELLIPMIPTRAGVYEVHLTGTIGDTPVDHTVLPEEVEPADLLQFPDSLLAENVIQASVIDLQQEVAAARQQALVGLILGGVGTFAGIMGIVIYLVNRRD